MSSIHLFTIPGSPRLVTISGTPLCPALFRNSCVSECERENGRKKREMGAYFLGHKSPCCHCAHKFYLLRERGIQKKRKVITTGRLNKEQRISIDLQRKAIGWFSNYIHSSIHLYLSLCNFRSVLDTELIMGFQP